MYAMECSAIAEQAKAIVAASDFAERITVVTGKVEEVELPNYDGKVSLGKVSLGALPTRLPVAYAYPPVALWCRSLHQSLKERCRYDLIAARTRSFARTRTYE